MKVFEPHIHMYSRVTDDYERMALAGIRELVEPAFWLGQPRTRLGTFVDYFSAISGFEVERAAQYGIRHWCTIAMNPREANDEKLAAEVMDAMLPFLALPTCVAVGEVGYDQITPAEEKCFLAQMEIARKHGLPVLVHTPHVDKRRGTERSLAVVKESGIPEEMVLIDHNTEETIGMVREKTGCWAGHSIYTRTKLTPERAANILEEFGTERMLINSAADWGPSDPLNVPKTVLELERRGFPEEKIRQVVWDNPRAFFGQSGRFEGR